MSELKDRLLSKMLTLAGKEGWNNHTLEMSAQQLGMDPKFAFVGFPQGATEVMVYYMRKLDKEMLNAFNQSNNAQKKVRQKAIDLIFTRLKLLNPHKDAAKAILQFIIIPSHSIASAESLAITCDVMWKAIGDTATDFNYYSKRFLLASVYSSTLMYWIKDESPNNKETMRFLEERIEQLFAVVRKKNNVIESATSIVKNTFDLFKKR